MRVARFVPGGPKRTHAPADLWAWNALWEPPVHAPRPPGEVSHTPRQAGTQLRAARLQSWLGAITCSCPSSVPFPVRPRISRFTAFVNAERGRRPPQGAVVKMKSFQKPKPGRPPCPGPERGVPDDKPRPGPALPTQDGSLACGHHVCPPRGHSQGPGVTHWLSRSWMVSGRGRPRVSGRKGRTKVETMRMSP